MDRVFGTVQNRLPQELRLSKITTLEAANSYLKEQFLPDYNACFAVPAAEPGPAFVPYSGRPLEDVLCIQEDRQAARDNCVVWKGRALQIPPQRHRHHYVKATVARARIFRWPPRRLRRAKLPRALRPQRKAGQCFTGRLTPRGAPSLWICGQRSRVAHKSTGRNISSGHLMCYERRTSSRATDRVSYYTMNLLKCVNIDWINAGYVEAAHKLMEIALIDGIQLSTLGLVPRSLARELRVPSRSDQDTIRGDWSSSRAATCPEFV